jgi:hypothetical protein
MNKNSFNSLVRPAITTIPIGKRAIAFDRLELDAWAESYCRRNGRPAHMKEGQLCRNDELQGSVSGSGKVARLSGISTNASSDSEDFARALERVMRKKPQGISRGASKKSAKPRSMERDRGGSSDRPQLDT